MGTGAIIGIVAAAVVVLIVLWFIGAYNKFVGLKNKIDEAFSTMDVYLKKRYDLIPNLVETVKGYAKHEQGTLEKVIAARNMAANAVSVEKRLEGENALASTLKTLFAVAENYPELKANANFIDLQNQLKYIEDEIAQSRKYYNAVVREFNTMREVFPSSVVASMFNFERRALFEIAAEERQNVKVQF